MNTLRPTQRWIKPAIIRPPASSPEESLLPKGEGQDEGEPRAIPQRRAIPRKKLQPPSGRSGAPARREGGGTGALQNLEDHLLLHQARQRLGVRQPSGALTYARLCNRFENSPQERAMTLIELFVILLVITVLAALILPAWNRARTSADRIQCNNNQKQIGLAFRIWEGAHTNLYPMAVSMTNGGTMEYVTGPNVFRHFQIMSNELSTPWIMICPADAARSRATDWINFNNSNLSYFVGVQANETNPQMILSGDRSFTNGLPLKNGIMELRTNQSVGWTAELHRGAGNIALADGSVQQANTENLRDTVANTGLPTNLIQMPVLK